MKCERERKSKMKNKEKEKRNEQGTEEERLEETREALTCVPPCQFVWLERFFFLWKT